MDNDHRLAIKEVWIDPNFSNETKEVQTHLVYINVYITAVDYKHIMVGINRNATLISKVSHHLSKNYHFLCSYICAYLTCTVCGKIWHGKNLANLANIMSFANVLHAMQLLPFIISYT